MSSQNVLDESYRQPETVQLAPDAIVFINGSNLLTDPLGNKFDIRQDITEINTSLNVDSQGTANFTISYPEHSGGRLGIKKYANLKIMSEVVIYFRGRFLKDDKYPYYQAFWGIISGITEAYSDGVHTLSVSCADILRWWQITNITINASVLATRENIVSYLNKNYGIEKEDCLAFLKGLAVFTKKGRQVSLFSNILSGLTIPEIFDKLCTISMLQMMPIDDYLQKTSKATSVSSDLREKMSINQMEYWQKRLNFIGRRLRIYGLTDKNGRLDIDMSKIIFMPLVLKTEYLNKKTTNIVVYKSIPNTPPVMKSDRKSQYEIANEVKETIHFEFFMDVNGDIVFKPPFYNLDVTKNVNSIIHDVDIFNWNFVQSEEGVITRVDVSGLLSRFSSENKTVNGIAFDPFLALQFGERPIKRDMEWLRTSEQCLFWGNVELARQNALIRQGSVTIVGRPELKLGYPVFIPSRDAFYYVKGIENRFSFGGTFQTTLTLIAERRKTETKLGLFRTVGEIKDEQISTVGNSNFVPDETNNYIKQASTMSICSSKVKDSVTLEANFPKDLTKISSDLIGGYEIISDVKIEELSKDFQITDSNGYEVIGKIGGSDMFMHYGYYDNFTENSTIESKKSVDVIRTASVKALSIDVVNSQLEINPNNEIITLDSIESRLVDFGKTIPEEFLTPSKNYNPNYVYNAYKLPGTK
jgi:hypothetical protein